MSLKQLITSFPWVRYSKKMALSIEKPKFFGSFEKSQADARDLRLSIGKVGAIQQGNELKLYLLVDKDDGIIIDAKYLAFGQSALIGALEAACHILIGKNYDQAKRITAELLDKSFQDKSDHEAFPKETYPYINLVLEAIEMAANQCTDLPLSLNYIAPPAPTEIGEVLEGGYPGFKELSLEQKKALIESVLDQDVRPYIALDAGGVTLLDFVNDKEVLIAYQGSCTSCYSSVGTTLSFIQQTLRAKVYPDIVVVPELGDMFR